MSKKRGMTVAEFKKRWNKDTLNGALLNNCVNCLSSLENSHEDQIILYVHKSAMCVSLTVGLDFSIPSWNLTHLTRTL